MSVRLLVTGLTSLLLLCWLRPPGFAASSNATISASVAGLYVGEVKVVEGKVISAHREGNVVRLRLGDTPQALTVSLVIGLLSDFPPAPESYYLGHRVRVAGMIRSFREVPEIVLHDVGDIRVVDTAAEAAVNPPSAAAAPAPESAVLQRLDALGERLRVLEERVQHLESPTPGAAK